MNIGIGKFGKSILFDSKKWGAIGGDLDAPVMIELIAKRNPQHKFYLLGHSDYSRLSESKKSEVNPNNNIIDCWEGHKGEPYTNVLLEYFKKNNIKLDLAFLHNGISGNANVPNCIKTIKGDAIAKTLFCFRKYTGPIIHFLNVTQLPYFTVSVDPRYTPLLARDLFNQPRWSVSQINDYTQKKRKHIKSYENQELMFSETKHIYSGVETLFLTMKKKLTWWEFSKARYNNFVVILNEGGNGAVKRGPMLKEYVLDKLKNVEVYGQWSEEWMKDERFKGPKKFNELESVLGEVKYTFIIPIEKGWVTAKFWEMAHYGIIPFMYPTYDSDKNIKCPDFIRVSSPEELQEKITYLEAHPEEYLELLKQLHDLLEEKYYNGDFINNTIMDNCNKLQGEKCQSM